MRIKYPLDLNKYNWFDRAFIYSYFDGEIAGPHIMMYERIYLRDLHIERLIKAEKANYLFFFLEEPLFFRLRVLNKKQVNEKILKNYMNFFTYNKNKKFYPIKNFFMDAKVFKKLTPKNYNMNKDIHLSGYIFKSEYIIKDSLKLYHYWLYRFLLWWYKMPKTSLAWKMFGDINKNPDFEVTKIIKLYEKNLKKIWKRFFWLFFYFYCIIDGLDFWIGIIKIIKTDW